MSSIDDQINQTTLAFSRQIGGSISEILAQQFVAPGFRDQAIVTVVRTALYRILKGVEEQFNKMEASHENKMLASKMMVAAMQERGNQHAIECNRLRSYEVELRRIAETVGESGDPFAVWETVDLMLRRQADFDQEIRRMETRVFEAENFSGAKDKDGNKLYLGDRVLYRTEGSHTKPEYWNPEYVIVREGIRFTLQHVGGGKDGGSHDFILRTGGGSLYLELLRRGNNGQPT